MTTSATITAAQPADIPARDPPRLWRVRVTFVAHGQPGEATFVCAPCCPVAVGDRWSCVVPELGRLQDGPGWEDGSKL
jgi:hypothetical protein